MRILLPKNHRLHSPEYEYYDGTREPYAEKPERIDSILKGCERLGLPVEERAESAPREVVEKLHRAHYVAYVEAKTSELKPGEQLMPSNFIRDTYTPLTPDTYDVALQSAELAIHGANELLRSGETIYALCRPPGHHAESDAMSGYCYFNNAALAAEQLSRHGKVAILDIDYHHGNGTQEIFYERDDVLYVSLHADPATSFPFISGFANETGAGTGKGFTINHPLAADTSVKHYLEVLQKAVNEIQDFSADYVVLSLGFDTFEHDPIGGLNIDEASYATIGELLATQLKQPTLIVQEGGYNVDKLDVLAENFLKGYLKPQDS